VRGKRGLTVVVKVWQVGVFTYGVLYFILAGAMEAENLHQSYPVIYVLLSMIAQTLVVGGVIIFGLEASLDFSRMWRWLFPLLILELAAGVVFDATVPSVSNLSTDRVEWVGNELFGLWLALPAYYFNFRIARYRS